MLPVTEPRPSAWAALMVEAMIASAGVMRSERQASAIVIGTLGVNEEPGLKSVASATGVPASISRRAGA